MRDERGVALTGVAGRVAVLTGVGGGGAETEGCGTLLLIPHPCVIVLNKEFLSVMIPEKNICIS